MRILFTTFPGYGHFHPIVPFATAAIARGDEVLFATSREFGNWVAECGFPVVAAGWGLDDLEAQSRARFPGRLQAAHMFTTVAVPPMLDDLVDISTRWHPDLIVHEESEFAAPLVASLIGVPCITHSWPAPARPKVEHAFLAGFMQPIWEQHHRGGPRLWGEIYLDVCPPPFQTDGIQSISGVRSMRPVLFDGPTTSPPAWLDRIERPAAYVSFGTVAEFSRPEVLQSTMDAASHVVASVVVTTGPNTTEMVDPPATAVVVQYVPQTVVLPHIDVVISHGGAGTTLGALQHGLPHVVIPQGGMSQQRNAERIDALGIGIRLTQTDDQESLQAAIHAALTVPSYATQAGLARKGLLNLSSPGTVLSQLADELT